MGFIKAAMTSASTAWKDGKFLEVVSVPEVVANDVMAVKGVQQVSDPDGVVRQSNNQTTGLLSDGSKVIVPQGYVALAISNGKFLVDMAIEPGLYEWKTGNRSTMFFNENGIFKGIGNVFSQMMDRFKFGGQVSDAQEIVFIKTQPILGVKFGTKNPVEIMSPTYRNLSIRFFGECDILVHDPIMFYINIASRRFNTKNEIRFAEFGDTIREHLPPAIAVALTRYAFEHKTEIHGMNMIMDEVSKNTAKLITNQWSSNYGLGIGILTIHDISYDEKSQEKIEKYDEKFIERDNFMEYERMKAQNEAMIAMAKNEAKGAGMNAMMGMAMMPQMMNMMNNAFNTTTTQTAPTPQVTPTVEPVIVATPQPVEESVPLHMQFAQGDDPLGLLKDE